MDRSPIIGTVSQNKDSYLTTPGLHHHIGKFSKRFSYYLVDFKMITSDDTINMQTIFDLSPRVWEWYGLPWTRLHLSALSTAENRSFWPGRRSYSHNSIGKVLNEVVRWPKRSGTWRSSAYPSARHCVIKVLPHLAYQVKNNDLQQLKIRKEKDVATVTHNIIPNMRWKVEHRLNIYRAA